MIKNNSPLFIVGLSRSGTKLLRDILNNHPKIQISTIETHFMASLLQINENQFNFKESYSVVVRSKFYKTNKYFNRNNDYTNLKEIVDKSDDKLLAFLEYILKTAVGKKINETFIWGDKTPKNLRILDKLIERFPDGKVIHIVRDPRDRCMSVHNTWKKSITRAAYLWNKEIQESDTIIQEFFKSNERHQNYLEVKFEELLSDSEEVLSSVCDFLSISFNSGMTVLQKPSEKYGKASDSDKIVSENKKKFLEFDQDKVLLVEQICFYSMKKKGYEPIYAKYKKEVDKIKLEILRVFDFFVFHLSNIIKGY